MRRNSHLSGLFDIQAQRQGHTSQKVVLHLKTPDLLHQIVFRVRLLSLGFPFRAARENVRCPLHEALLPSLHLIRMNLIFARDLGNRQFPSQRFQRHAALELAVVRLFHKTARSFLAG